MRTYTIHLPSDAVAGESHGLDRAVLVPDGFSLQAFVFGPLWFFFHRLWLAGLGVLSLLVAAGFAGRFLGLGTFAGFLITILLLLLVGMEASSLRRWTYARRGRPARDAVVAHSAEEAEMKAVNRWLTAPPVVRPGPTAYPAASARPVDTAIGMFPFAEPRRS
ncbi:DUF2628 domain-containing protein [Methylobacterium sp. WCS2018Hpa-22]|uniref:DUF2628 domain-containing protein n=1 Tax=Methylobacterium sp. WCS2018Hpa-22 TaxID=3073633 RepID=UPI00288A4858|nr:DUF2628 domain-containing protein [Methylobacterium sp. WCS2018Hpa-22]